MTTQPFKKNRAFVLGVAATILEGLLSGCNFMVLYVVMQMLARGAFAMPGILAASGALAVIFLLRLGIYSFGYTQGQIGGAAVSRALRLHLADKLKRMPLSRFSRAQTGDHINVITSDVANYEKLLTHKVGDLAKNITLSLALMVFAATIWLPAGVLFLAADLLLVPALWCSFRAVRKYGNEKNAICAENVSSIVEYVSGIQTLRAYGIGGVKNRAVTEAMKAFSEVSYVYEARTIPPGSVMGALVWSSCAVVMVMAGEPFLRGQMDLVNYLLLCMMPLFLAKLAVTLFVDLTSYKNLAISRAKIQAVFDMPNESGWTAAEAPLVPEDSSVSFEHVAFAYTPGEPVLRDVSFTAPAERLTAIVGDSGSGKSTIMNLIAKYYEPDAGRITIGGVDTSRYAAEQVLAQVALVDQEVFLFDDTVRENIRHARPSASDAEIEAVCRAANCEAFIRKLPQGYDTVIGENGNLLSGGERQRLSIARAMLKNAPVVLLDEATASLDIENALAVRQAIAALLAQRQTVLMIAHTLSLVRHADQILVVDEGRIAERGTHDALLALDGKYAAMWQAEQAL